LNPFPQKMGVNSQSKFHSGYGMDVTLKKQGN